MRTKISALAVLAGLALVFTGVLYGQVAKQAPPIERTQWKLTWVEGTTVESTAPRTAFIMLNPVTHRMSGSGGCNHLTGVYELDGGHLQFKGPARTMMACAGGMGVEDKLVDALEKVRQWKISSDELELQDDSGQDLARFVPTPGQ